MAPLVLLLLLLSLREYSSAFNSHGEILNQKHKLAPCFLQRNSADQLQHQQLQHQQLQQQRRQIVLSSDIHSHPGPTPSSASGKKPRRVSYPCTVCDRGVTKARKAVSCDACNRWTHVKCSASISLSKYESCVREGGEIAFTCDSCSFSTLPYNDDAEVAAVSHSTHTPFPALDQSSPSPLSSCPIPSTLTQKGLHLLHANVRSLLPKIAEIQLLLNRTKTAVFAATETWLDSTINDGEIKIPGFNVI